MYPYFKLTYQHAHGKGTPWQGREKGLDTCLATPFGLKTTSPLIAEIT